MYTVRSPSLKWVFLSKDIELNLRDQIDKFQYPEWFQEKGEESDKLHAFHLMTFMT